jgi:hypothetical protein
MEQQKIRMSDCPASESVTIVPNRWSKIQQTHIRLRQ